MREDIIERENSSRNRSEDNSNEWEQMSADLDRAVENISRDVAGRISIALNWVEGDDILDIGCYRGIYSYDLARKGKRVAGVDVDQESLEIAAKKFKHPNLQFSRTDGTNLAFPAESFDCALLLEVLEHTWHPRGLIAEIFRVLRPGGRLIVSVPNAASYHTLARTLLLPVSSYFTKMESWDDFATDQRDHYYYWDAFTLYRLLNRQGFVHLDHSYIDNRRAVNMLGRVIPPLKKMSTCFLILVRKPQAPAE